METTENIGKKIIESTVKGAVGAIPVIPNIHYNTD